MLSSQTTYTEVLSNDESGQMKLKLEGESNVTEQTKGTSDNYELSKHVENPGEPMTCK